MPEPRPMSAERRRELEAAIGPHPRLGDGYEIPGATGVDLRGALREALASDAIRAEQVRQLREALRNRVCGVDGMSWHGEAMLCDLCGARWNNGKKRGEPATPENHVPDCLLAATAEAE